MLQEYELTGDLARDDYSKYQDAYNRWLAERSYAQGNADTAYDRGYNQWLQELNQRNKDREFEESVRQYNENLAEQKRQYNASLASRSSSGGGSGDNEPKKKAPEEDAIPDSAVIANKHSEKGGWIAIGGSRWTYQEVANMVNSGKVKETYDKRTNKVTYTRVK